jgi:hypothetical protein
MRWMKWLGLISALLLIFSCFFPWVIIISKDITIRGVDSTGTNFGKPGYFHLFLSFLFIVFNFIERIWAKRINIFVVAINLAWAIRNYIIISACQGGECPEKKTALYTVVLGSILMLVTALFPDIEVQNHQEPNQEKNS